MDKPVYDSRQIPDQYDYIIVANSYTTEIYNLAKKLGVDCSKIIFLYGVKQQVGCIDKDVLKEILLEKNYTDYCGEFGLVDSSFIDDDARTYTRMNKKYNFQIKKEYI